MRFNSHCSRHPISHGGGGGTLRCSGLEAWAVRATTGNGYESPDAKRVLVIEGDSRIGVQIVKTFQDPSNHWKVTALVSGRDEKKQKYARALEALQVNLCEQSYDSVMKTAPYDVVISCITTGKADVEPVYARNQVFVDAAVELGVSKYVFLSSVGAGSSEVALPGPAKETMKPFMTDKHRAEQYLESASMDHLVVRCAPLNDILEDTALGKPMLTEAPEAYGWVTAAGVADIVYQCLTAGQDVSGTYSAVDRNTVFVTNPFLRPLESHESLPFEAYVL